MLVDAELVGIWDVVDVFEVVDGFSVVAVVVCVVSSSVTVFDVKLLESFADSLDLPNADVKFAKFGLRYNSVPMTVITKSRRKNPENPEPDDRRGCGGTRIGANSIVGGEYRGGEYRGGAGRTAGADHAGLGWAARVGVQARCAAGASGICE